MTRTDSQGNPSQEPTDTVTMTGREFDRIMSAITQAKEYAQRMSGLAVECAAIERLVNQEFSKKSSKS